MEHGHVGMMMCNGRCWIEASWGERLKSIWSQLRISFRNTFILPASASTPR